ncbi:MAG: hypothetical protein WBG50_12615 [Desulfomonilaceae bacterium]
MGTVNKLKKDQRGAGGHEVLGKTLAALNTESDEDFELIIDKRHKFHGNILTMNASLGRIVLSSQLYDHAKERYGKEISHVQLLLSRKGPVLMIVPCDADVPGARGVHIASGSRVISAKLLVNQLKEMGWKTDAGNHFTAEWSDKVSYKGLRVDLKNPIDMESK